MLTKTLTAIISLSAALGFSQVASAAQEAVKPATVIIYRADESIKTSRLRPSIYANDSSLSRLDREEVMVLASAPGAYTLGSSMPGTEQLTLDLKPGATYYVHTQVELRGARVYVSMVEVEEQVARVQQPEIGAAI